MSHHRIIFPDLPDQPPPRLLVTGDEAHHAIRVKRLAVGDPVDFRDGRGGVGVARVADTFKHRSDWTIALDVETFSRAPRPSHLLHVRAATPKGDRLEAMADALAQLGVASFAPLISARTIAEPRPARLDRLDRIALEAVKQSGCPWKLEIAPPISFADALASDYAVILADASGTPSRAPAGPRAMLLVGPEGGWTPDELAAARAANVRVHRFASHTLRTETAAVVAAGVLLAAAL